MPSLAQYFAANRYKAVYSIGDRVRGVYNGVPFAGSVGNDTLISEEEGPRVSVHVDLPIDGKTVIFVKHKDIKKKYEQN